MAEREQIFTVGHSNHSIEHLIEILKSHEITALADVRSTPFSRFNPQFNKGPLAKALKKNGISYVFLGKELGARSEDKSLYEGGRVQYRRLAKTGLFRSGLDRLINGAQTHRISLMCAEKEPLDCHRTILVARELANQGLLVAHIHADGRVESHTQAVDRLMGILGIPREDLFRPREDLINEAYTRQEAKIAYIEAHDELHSEEPSA